MGKDRSIEIRVGEARAPLVAADAGGRLSIPLPERFLKEERRTLIWKGEVDGIGPAIYKVYRHRSLSSRLCRPFWTSCAQREYRALLRLEEGGVDCTEPIFWGIGSSPDHGRLEVLVTREIPGAMTLREGFRTGKLPLSAAFLQEVAARARGMHRRGAYHGAFSWKNVLVGGDRLQVHVADLARSLLFPRDISGSRMAWFDLLHFSSHIEPAGGVDSCRSFLDAYGLEARSADRLIRALDRYDPENKRWPRRLRRLEFLGRMSLSRLGALLDHPAADRCGPRPRRSGP